MFISICFVSVLYFWGDDIDDFDFYLVLFFGEFVDFIRVDMDLVVWRSECSFMVGFLLVLLLLSLFFFYL